MRFHQRAAAVIASEGFTGLLRRGVRKLVKPLLPKPPDHSAAEATEAAEIARQQALFPAMVAQFNEEVRRRNLGEVEHFYWYHTVDLGDGLVTPGDYDFRAELPAYHFPESMHGWKVLDVGSATGFFAFEFERRGADVVSVDLPSLADWDMIWSEREALVKRLMAWQHAATPEELHWRHLEGPFQFCHRALGSRVRRCLSRVYDLTPARLGVDCFDLVFVGDLLGHLFSPLHALNALAPMSRRMVLCVDNLPTLGEAPLLLYAGGESAPNDGRTWFLAGWVALKQMLKRLGFTDVRIVGSPRVLLRRVWKYMDRVVIHATR